MLNSIRATPSPFTTLFVALALCCLLSACSTRPLGLQSIIRPLEYVPEYKHEPLHMVSFVDEMGEEERNFGEQRKTFRLPPADVLNDTLLVSLRQSQGFQLVDRNQPSIENGYILGGRLIALGTEERFWKFGFSASSMKINATCVTEFQLKDAQTGEVLLQQTVTSNGEGYARENSGGGNPAPVTTYNSPGQPTHTTGGGGSTVDSTSGYEESMSEAIANNVATVTQLVITELSRRVALADAEAAAMALDLAPAIATPTGAPQNVSTTPEATQAVGAPPPE